MDIAPWYVPVMAVPDKEVLDKRQAATDKTAKSITITSVLDLVRLAFGLGDFSAPVESALNQYAKADQNFVPTAVPVECEILAGCVLGSLMSQSSEMGRVASLAVLCAGGLFDRAPKHHPKLLSLAEEYWRVPRRSAQIGAPIVNRLKTDASKAIASITEQSTPAEFLPAIKSAFDATAKDHAAIAETFCGLAETIGDLQHQVDVLWWMNGGWSDTLKMPYSNVSAAAAPIVAAFDLSKVAGEVPVSAKAVLHRVLSNLKSNSSTKFTTIEAVNATPRTWLEKLLMDKKCKDTRALCPVSLAIGTSLGARPDRFGGGLADGWLIRPWSA